MVPLKACHLSTFLLLLATCLALANCAALDTAASVMATDAYATGGAAAAPDALEDKNEDAILQMPHKRPSFFVGSRYGRSGTSSNSNLLFAPSKARRLNMVPRNDRFFLGSRYGKRSNEYVSPYEQASDNTAAAPTFAVRLNGGNSNNNNNIMATPYMMSCMYTGLRNLYRCNSVEEINNIINQLTTAQNDDDKRK